MIVKSLAHPNVNAASRLMQETTDHFASYPFVNHVLLFGSFARGESDRWSDVDMLVVTNGGTSQQWQLFDGLRQHKPILHHHIFTPHAEPAGGNVLGIVFKNESVFHNLDLNFMSLTQFSLQNSLDRFGPTKKLYASNSHNMSFPRRRESTNLASLDTHPHTHDMLVISSDETRIGMGIHWTKKAIKRVLRGDGNIDELIKAFARLKEIMQDSPKDMPTSRGNICRVARTYIKIADQVLGAVAGVPTEPHKRKKTDNL